MTMTELSRPLSPNKASESVASQHQNAFPNQTLFGSEDFNLRERANQSGAFDLKSHNMQIVDEADETETLLNRPSFFDAMQMDVKVKQPVVTQNTTTAKTSKSPAKHSPGKFKKTDIAFSASK